MRRHWPPRPSFGRKKKGSRDRSSSAGQQSLASAAASVRSGDCSGSGSVNSGHGPSVADPRAWEQQFLAFAGEDADKDGGGGGGGGRRGSGGRGGGTCGAAMVSAEDDAVTSCSNLSRQKLLGRRSTAKLRKQRQEQQQDLKIPLAIQLVSHQDRPRRRLSSSSSSVLDVDGSVWDLSNLVPSSPRTSAARKPNTGSSMHPAASAANITNTPCIGEVLQDGPPVLNHASISGSTDDDGAGHDECGTKDRSCANEKHGNDDGANRDTVGAAVSSETSPEPGIPDHALLDAAPAAGTGTNAVPSRSGTSRIRSGQRSSHLKASDSASVFTDVGRHRDPHVGGHHQDIDHDDDGFYDPDHDHEDGDMALYPTMEELRRTVPDLSVSEIFEKAMDIIARSRSSPNGSRRRTTASSLPDHEAMQRHRARWEGNKSRFDSGSSCLSDVSCESPHRILSSRSYYVRSSSSSSFSTIGSQPFLSPTTPSRHRHNRQQHQQQHHSYRSSRSNSPQPQDESFSCYDDEILQEDRSIESSTHHGQHHHHQQQQHRRRFHHDEEELLDDALDEDISMASFALPMPYPTTPSTIARRSERNRRHPSQSHGSGNRMDRHNQDYHDHDRDRGSHLLHRPRTNNSNSGRKSWTNSTASLSYASSIGSLERDDGGLDEKTSVHRCIDEYDHDYREHADDDRRHNSQYNGDHHDRHGRDEPGYGNANGDVGGGGCRDDDGYTPARMPDCGSSYSVVAEPSSSRSTAGGRVAPTRLLSSSSSSSSSYHSQRNDPRRTSLSISNYSSNNNSNNNTNYSSSIHSSRSRPPLAPPTHGRSSSSHHANTRSRYSMSSSSASVVSTGGVVMPRRSHGSFRRRSDSRVDHHHMDDQMQKAKAAASRQRLPHKAGRPLIEVSPGQYMPLRGAQETWECIMENKARQVQCLGCNGRLQCVPDCEIVMCSGCRMLSPVESMSSLSSFSPPPSSSSISKPSPSSIGGVGLGLKQDPDQAHTTSQGGQYSQQQQYGRDRHQYSRPPSSSVGGVTFTPASIVSAAPERSDDPLQNHGLYTC